MKVKSILSSAAIIAALTQVVPAQTALSTSTAATQNFDSIGTAASWTMPSNWRMSNGGATVRANAAWSGQSSSIASGTGAGQIGGNSVSSSAANGLYNFGAGAAGSATDRALGSISSGSGSKSSAITGYFRNTTGAAMSGVTVSFDLEKYRNGTNTAAFAAQMWYSTDGSNWTSAGTDFYLAFAGPDADNNGFTTAPGSTQSVTNKTLTVAIPNNGDLYLQWVLSVDTGTTTSNARAIALDNVSVLGVAPAGDTTAPTATASGNNVSLTAGTTLNGTNVGSVSDNVDAAGSIGVSATGAPSGVTVGLTNTAGTVTANVTTTCAAAPGSYPITVTATDAATNSNTFQFNVVVGANAAPTVGAYSNDTITVGGSSTRTPAAAPADAESSISTVVVSPTTFGSTGTASVVPSTGVVTVDTTAGTTPGTYNFSVTVTDACGQTDVENFDVTVNAAPPVDTTAPTLTTISIASNNTSSTLAKAGDVITVSIVADEPITAPTVTVAGNAASVSGTGTTYSATYTVQAGDAQGAAAIAISGYEDLATSPNAGFIAISTTDASSVVIDTVAPATSSTGAATFVGTSYVVDVTPEGGSTPTALYVRTPGSGSFTEATGASFAANQYTYTAAASGVYGFYVVATDAAGNLEVKSAADFTTTISTTVNGPLTLDITGDGTVVFPLTSTISVTITFTGVTTPGTLTVGRTEGDTNPTGYDAAKLIDQVLTITAGSGLAFTSAAVTVDYDEALLGGVLEGAIATAFRDEAGTVTEIPATVNTGANTIQFTTTGFSTWYFGETDASASDWFEFAD